MKIYPGPSPCCHLPASPQGLGEASTELVLPGKGRTGWSQAELLGWDCNKPRCHWSEPARSAINSRIFSCHVSLNLTNYFCVFLIEKDESSKCEHVSHPQTLQIICNYYFNFFDLIIQSGTQFRSWLTWHSEFSTEKMLTWYKLKSFRGIHFPQIAS